MSPMDVVFDLVTPAYAGGADLDRTDGLRPPTVRHLLRFWWRVLHPELSPHELFLREEALFGSTRLGQRLRVVPASAPYPDPQNIMSIGSVSPDPSYLAYGPVTRNNNTRRQEINVPRMGMPYSFSCSLLLPDVVDISRERHPRKTRPATALERLRWKLEIEAALWLLSAFGGFGARNRRGFGSILARSAHDDTPLYPLLGNLTATSLNEAETILRRSVGIVSHLPSVLDALTDERATFDNVRAEFLARDRSLEQSPSWHDRSPEHPAIWRQLRLVIGCTNKGEFYRAASDALAAISDDFLRFRRSLGWYGARGPTGPLRDATAPGGPDHAWRNDLQEQRRVPAHAVAARATHFGLPLNGRMSNGNHVDLSVVSEGFNRRASPVFFNVIRWGKAMYSPVVLYLPSRFLPDNLLLAGALQVEVSEEGQRRQLTPVWHKSVPDPGDEDIKRFFDALVGKQGSKSPECPAEVWKQICFPNRFWKKVF